MVWNEGLNLFFAWECLVVYSEMTVFVSLICLGTFVKNQLTINVVYFLTLFHWSVCLFLHSSTIMFWLLLFYSKIWNLKCKSSTFNFFSKVFCPFCLDFLHFYKHFRINININFANFCKNIFGILIGIMLCL